MENDKAESKSFMILGINPDVNAIPITMETDAHLEEIVGGVVSNFKLIADEIKKATQEDLIAIAIISESAVQEDDDQYGLSFGALARNCTGSMDIAGVGSTLEIGVTQKILICQGEEAALIVPMNPVGTQSKIITEKSQINSYFR